MNPDSKVKKFAFYNVVILLITVQLVIIINYWYFIFKNIGQATINDTIAYQGKLIDSTGAAVPDGQYNMEFSIWTADGVPVPQGGGGDGTLLWTERWSANPILSQPPINIPQNSHPGSQVTVTKGIFSVDLNSLCASWTAAPCASGSGVNFDSGSLYLEVKFDAIQDVDNTMDQTFAPRKRFSSIAYAMNAAKLNGSIVGDSGDAIPLLSGSNTWSGSNDFGALTSSSATFTNVTLTGALTVGGPSVDGIVISPSVSTNTQNLILQSQTFDNASWTATGGSISANSGTAPDSSLTADKFVEDSANTSKTLTQPFTYASSTTYTMSIYAKAAGRNYIGLQFEGSSYATGVYTLTGSGAVSLAFGSGTPSITSVGNGWYRCMLTSTVASGAVGNYTIFISNDGVSQTYQGDGISGVNFWGAQLETAGSAGTYAPTTSSQVVPGSQPSSIASAGTGADVNLLIKPKGAGTLTVASNSSIAILINNAGAGNDIQSANWSISTTGGYTGKFADLQNPSDRAFETLHLAQNNTGAFPVITLANSGTGLDIDATTWSISHAGLLTGSASLNLLKAGDTMTGDLSISKADPELRLIDIGNSEYSRLTRSATDNKMTLYNRVLVPGVAPIVLSPHELSFSGVSNQYVDLTDDAALKPTAAISIETWYKSTDAANYSFLVSAGNPNATAYGYSLTYSYGVGLSFQIGQSGVHRDVNYGFPDNYPPGQPNISDGNWHHVVGTYDGHTQILYFDGVAGTPLSWEGAIGYQAYPVLIGATNFTGSASYFFNGTIDEVKIYNTALTPTQVAASYNSGLGKYGSAETGLVAGYHFDEDTGSTTADFSGNSLTGGTLVNSPSWQVGERAPAPPASLSFDDNTRYISLLDNALLRPTTGISVDTWIYPTNVNGAIESLVTQDYVALTNKGYALLIASPGTLIWRGGDGSAYFNRTTTISNYNWYHIVGTWSGADGARLYVNNVEIGSPEVFAGPLLYTAQPTKIGSWNYSGGDYNFSGQIDEVKIWSKALSPAEVTASYNGTAGLYGSAQTSLVAGYHFDEGSGTLAHDYAGNNLNGDLVGSPTWVTGTMAIAPATMGASLNNSEVAVLQSQDGVVEGEGGIVKFGSLTGQTILQGSNVWVSDSNGNPILKTGQVASSVNYLTITNGATGTAPIFAADGTDTNVGLELHTKGTGVLTMNAGNVMIPSQSATAIPLIIKGFASQTGDLQQWQDSTGTVKASVGTGGMLTATGMTLTAPFTADCSKLYMLAGVVTCGSDETGGGGGGGFGGTMTSLFTNNVVTQNDSSDALVSDIAISGGGNAYVLSANMGAASTTDFTTTYNITGVSNSAGVRFSLDLEVKKAITGASQTHTIAVKVNGTLIVGITYNVTGAAADQLSHGYDFKWNPFTSAWVVTTIY